MIEACRLGSADWPEDLIRVATSSLDLTEWAPTITASLAIAWAGPLEHLLQDAWCSASRIFPGLLLEAFAAGGTPDVSAARVAGTIAVFMAVGVVLATVTFIRRDVSA